MGSIFKNKKIKKIQKRAKSFKILHVFDKILAKF